MISTVTCIACHYIHLISMQCNRSGMLVKEWILPLTTLFSMEMMNDMMFLTMAMMFLTMAMMNDMIINKFTLLASPINQSLS